MTHPSKRIGIGFEHRVVEHLKKLGIENAKRQWGSGSIPIKGMMGDIMLSLTTETNLYEFLCECKKTNHKSFVLSYEWVVDIRVKSAEVKRIPIIMFSGLRLPIFVAIEENIFYRLFGNYPIVIKDYKARAQKHLTINWSKLDPLLKGSLTQNDILKAARADMITPLLLLELDEFIKHLRIVL